MPHFPPFHFASVRFSCSRTVFGAAMLAICMAGGGCSTPVQRDVYEQKLSGEIRVLEDQLYDADYQNRVLRDRLEQCRKAKACEPSEVELGSAPMPPDSFSASGPGFLDGSPVPIPDSPDGIMDSGSMMHDSEAPFQDFVPPPAASTQILETDEWGVIEIDPGEVVSDQPATSAPVGTSSRDGATSSSDPSPESLPTPTPKFDSRNNQTPRPLSDPLPATAPEPQLPAAAPQPQFPPAAPQPPGKRDLKAPALIPGDIQPPSGDPEADLLPPGKIELPEGIKDDVPVEIQIHPQFTGGTADPSGEVDQIMVVVHATDATGKTVPLENFDVQADLSVIVMDPELPVGKDKIGRWDFSPTQTSTMIRARPVSGLHIPIRWGDVRPTGSEIVVHARLRSEGESLKCHSRLPLQKPVEVSAVWTPRAK